jgi:hypothetical protein
MSNRTRTPRASRWQQAPALVISLVALFAALSGAALALPGTQTVNSGDIKDNAVKSIDLKDNAAVTTDDVVDETLTGTDVADGAIAGNDVTDESIASNDVQNETLLSTDIADQAITGADVAGDTLEANDLAPSSVRSEELGDGIHNHSEAVVVAGGTGQNANYNFNSVTATCGNGEELISGSGHWVGDANGEELMLSEVLLDHNAETVTVKGGNDFGVDRTLVAVASCL